MFQFPDLMYFLSQSFHFLLHLYDIFIVTSFVSFLEPPGASVAAQEFSTGLSVAVFFPLDLMFYGGLASLIININQPLFGGINNNINKRSSKTRQKLAQEMYIYNHTEQLIHILNKHILKYWGTSLCRRQAYVVSDNKKYKLFDKFESRVKLIFINSKFLLLQHGDQGNRLPDFH